MSELKKHALSKKHLEIQQSMKSSQPITSMVTQDTTSKQVKRAEIKVASFLVEHNLPFNLMDHLSDLVTDVFPDSKIASRFKCKHTKARSVVKHVLADPCREEVIKTLTDTKFSMIIDESTDISAKKQLAVVVRYFCEVTCSIRSQFLKLIEVTHSDATTITDTLVSFFERSNIPLLNIIGYASETTNVMFGEHHSVVRLLKDKIPNLFVMHIFVPHMHVKSCHVLLRIL